MDLKSQIITDEQHFIDVLNILNPVGHYSSNNNNAQQCPYHTGDGGSDSFSWHKEGDVWKGKCFSCGIGGDIIDIYANAKGLDTKKAEDFKKVLSELADILNIKDNRTPIKKEKVSNKKTEKILTDQDIEILTGKAHENVGNTDYFKNRGFTDETIETYRLGYTPSYKIKGFDNGPAAIVPYPNENYYFARMISPKGKMTKSFLKGKKLPIFNVDTIKDNDIIWVTEGQFDCLSILQVGFACVGTNSVSGNSKLIKYLKDNEITDKVFIVAYDADEPGDKGAEQLISLLEEEGFEAIRYRPTGGKDINEMLVNCKEKLLQDIIEMQDEAEPLLQALVYVETTSPIDGHKIMVDISGDDIIQNTPENFVDVDYENVNDVPVKKESVEDKEVESTVESEEQDFAPVEDFKYYIGEEGEILTGALVLYTVDHNEMFRKGNRLYVYNEETGIYDVTTETDMQQTYYEIARREGTFEDIDYTKCNNYVKTLMQIVPYEKDLADKSKFIACENGVINVVTGELLTFDPKYKLDCKFIGKFEDNYDVWLEKFNDSKFYKFLKDILVEDDTINTLQEMWGAMLAPNSTKLQQVFIYHGDGSNGKSSLFDIQEALFANKEQNICGISLGSFSEDKFILSNAQGKQVNIVRDDILAKKVGGSFKSAIAGEAVTTQEKNKQHTRQSFNMTWFYGVNELPNTEDKTHGYYRRNCIIPFNVTFGTEEEVEEGKADKIKIPGIVDDIIAEEIDIIFMWAYHGLRRLISNNYILTPNKASNKTMENYKMDTNSVYEFYKCEVVEAQGNIMTGNELFEKYEAWCKNNYRTNMGITKFGAQMKSFGVRNKRTKKGMLYYDIAVEFEEEHDIENPFDNVRQFKKY